MTKIKERLARLDDELRDQINEIVPRVLLYLAHRYHLDGDTARDVLHDALVAILEGRRVRKEGMSLFLFVIGTASSVASHRLERARLLVHEEVSESAPTSDPNPEEIAIAEFQKERFTRAIAQLKEPYRSIFTLRLQEDLTLAEIAGRLQISIGSVYTQYRRGLEQLKIILRERKETPS